jgi:glycerol-3-phosphate dehydrogenase
MDIAAPTRAPLAGHSFDVVVIGGGINGVAAARECARDGLRTLLVEQNDFASGTTSRSTRIIHGGLRYLEHGEIGLVRESLREREQMLREHPCLVHRTDFVLAVTPHGRRNALSIRAGLWLYRMMSGRSAIRRDLGELERLLDGGRRLALFAYDDAQCEFPERLVAEWLVEAIAAGCVARNHTRVLAVRTRDRRVHGVTLRDEFTGEETTVETRWIINASGPWADAVCRESGIATRQPMLGGVRGSHLILPRFAGAPDCVLYAEAPDGRPIFVVPWNQQLLVGTTEIADTGDPARARPSTDELLYLFRAFQQLFPSASVEWSDVRGAMAGVRPLPFAPGKNMGSVTRRHFLHDHVGDGAGGMFSIIGGKLTTAAQVGRECAAKLGVPAQPPLALGLAPSEAELETALATWTQQTAQTSGISETSARAIAQWHGARAADIAGIATAAPMLRAPLCDHSEHPVAEAVHAVRMECAVSLADILLRRVPVALGACWDETCTRTAAQRVGKAFGWDDLHIGREVEAFEEERAAFLVRPASARERAV